LGESRGLTEQVIDQIIEQTHDSQPALADLARRIEPVAGDLIEAWQGAHRDASAAGDAVIDLEDQVVRAWLTSLRQRNARQYFSDTATWAHRLATAGLAYGRALTLFREYQRCTIPFLMRVYPAGSELEIALAAWDDLFNANMLLIGATYVEAIRERVAIDARTMVLGQVFAGATNALNNLLAVVLGRMTLLIERTRGAEDRAELLDIQEAAARGAQMVRRLQEFMRDDRVDARVACDVNRLLHDAAEVTRFLWRDQAEAAGVVIDVVTDFADVPRVSARPAALREAFVIMIVNAVDALPRGGVITLRTERRGDQVLASVVNGAASSPTARASIATPFFAGSGVALSAAAKIAADLNGTLTVESKPEHGTSFILALPVAKGVSEEKEKTPMSSHPADVLLIDNEPSVRDAFTRLLALYGHRVTTAENGEKGIDAFKAGKFDVVFTDLGMPGMSGWDVARQIKQLDPKALIVLITGWPIELSQEKSKQTGVDRVVSKPIEMPQVLSLIEDAVALRGKT
jgi:CheY-like chemotaxis protein/signal transduction histidine kinase